MAQTYRNFGRAASCGALLIACLGPTAARGQDGWRAVGEKPADPAVVPASAVAPPTAAPPPVLPAILPAPPASVFPTLTPPPRIVEAPKPVAPARESVSITAPPAAGMPIIKPVPAPADSRPPARLPDRNATPVMGPAFSARPSDDPPPKLAAVARPASALTPASAPVLAGALPMSAAFYRPIAQLVAESEAQRWPGTPNELLHPAAWPDRVGLPAPMTATDGALPQSPTLDLSDLAACSPWWAEPMAWRRLPPGTLWLPPLADQRAPRMAVRSLRLNGASAIDTAIGGQWSLSRFSPVRRPDEGIGLEFLAAAFSRFDDRRRLQAIDYRVGLPIAYAKGAFSGKLGYEHQSSHLGDEHGEALGLKQQTHVRDEIVAAAALDWNPCWRTYAQAAHALHTAGAFTGRTRYGLGAEWQRRRETGEWGRPFAAADAEWREDQNYLLNATLQLGWQWRSAESGRSGRVAVERHNGNSPYGQFYLARESWWGFAASFDW